MTKSTKTILSFILLFAGLIWFMKANASDGTKIIDPSFLVPSEGTIKITIKPDTQLVPSQLISINGKDIVIIENDPIDLYVKPERQYLKIQLDVGDSMAVIDFVPTANSSYKVNYNHWSHRIKLDQQK